MGFFDRFRTAEPVVEPVAEHRIIGESRSPRDKILFHVKRFTLALEQCEKGPEREAELKRNLDYWTLQLQAHDLMEGQA